MFRAQGVFIVLFLLVLEVCLANTSIQYLHEEFSLEEVSHKDAGWLPYEEGMNRGLDNGIYWFRLEILASESQQIVRIPESHITRSQLYYDGVEVPKLTPKRYITFKISPSEENRTYYLKVNCLLEARIPIEVLTIDEYYSISIEEYMLIAFYYGIVIAILLFNLFSYVSFKSEAYLFYLFMVIGMTINPLYKDGMFAYFFGMNGINEVIEPYVSMVILVAAIFFTKSYLGVHNKVYWVRKLGIAMTLVCLILAIVFHVTRSFPILIITHGFELLTVDVFWLYGALLWRKSINARFFTIAYGIPLIAAHDFYFSPYFGFSLFHTSFTIYKLGSLFEMIVFSYAIMHFAKSLARKNSQYRLKIEVYAEQLKGYKSAKTNLDLDENKEVDYGFTETELNILKLISEKYKNKEIAEKSFISENTVKFHIKNIYLKLNVKNRNDARLLYKKLK